MTRPFGAPPSPVPTSVTQPTDSRVLAARCFGQPRDNPSVPSVACRGDSGTQATENRQRAGRKRGWRRLIMAQAEVLEFEESVCTRQDALLRSALWLVPDPF